jgi:Glycosyltransferase family 25 (LPS biosynthesis protein)
MVALSQKFRATLLVNRIALHGHRLVRNFRKWLVSEPGKLAVVVWAWRYALRRLLTRPPRSPGNVPQEIRGWFINLQSRSDRRRTTTEHLSTFPTLKLERWQATADGNGALGCAQSHASVLENFISQDLDFALVVEDDIEFLVSETELAEIVAEFLNDASLDVLCLANSNQISPRRISEALSISCSTQTAAAYLLKRRAAKPLLRKFRRSIALFGAGEPKKVAAIDQQWKPLQRGRLIFAVPHERVARQRPSFSDIEGRTVNYGV